MADGNEWRSCPQGIENRERIAALTESVHSEKSRGADREQRLRAVERKVTSMEVRIGAWAALGVIVGGILVQALTHFVFAW